jgi:hypothetical protein
MGHLVPSDIRLSGSSGPIISEGRIFKGER